MVRRHSGGQNVVVWASARSRRSTIRCDIGIHFLSCMHARPKRDRNRTQSRFGRPKMPDDGAGRGLPPFQGGYGAPELIPRSGATGLHKPQLGS
ncbi:uncharacterized protein P884DRAFT_263022 [Thermothelomyces heterothallicus CBS 202.75]|uniref:uncharacterized protein n=1 Tax=Thermothelomyces heterothallicus CBS 202.75 TaxID=1149848 RepID=UPI003742A5B1